MKESNLDKKLKKGYQGRTVFITGADGFLGSHLTEKLLEYKADVHVFVRATSSGELQNIDHLKKKMTVYRGNLIDKHSIELALKNLQKKAKSKPIVFHLAAQAHVAESWERPYETFQVNTIGTLNLLQSIVDLSLEIEKFDTAGTSEEYGNIREEVRDQYDFDCNNGLILHERSPINPKSIYATSKVAADFLTMNYFDGYGVPGVVTRMFNNYGPRQNPRYITGVIITQALSKSIIQLGHLRPMRDFCYCEDGARGHMTVALLGKRGEMYCYGQGENISMGDWAKLILKVGEEEGYWSNRKVVSSKERLKAGVSGFRPGKSDVMRLQVGYEKLNRETGWKPKFTWEEGIRRTIKWYAENKQRWISRIDW